MTNSYNTTNNDGSDVQAQTIIGQELLFESPAALDNYTDEDGNPAVPIYVNGSRVWVWDKETHQWQLEHIVVQGDETIKQGDTGASAYDIWISLGNQGTEQDFIDSLKGEPGEDGDDGLPGRDGTNGINGENGSNGTGSQGPKGDPGDAICAETELPPTSGERGKLWIDSVNQIIVTLG